MGESPGTQVEITLDRARAAVSTTGATLREFDVDGVPYVESFGTDESPPLGAGAVLVPWPNRVAGASWTHGGTTHELEVTEPARGNAIHGLVRREPWTVTEHDGSSATLRVQVADRPGWPFAFATAVTYRLTGDGLVVTHEVRNTGPTTMPFGVGAHPYPRPGTVDVDDCQLRLAAGSVLPVDPDRMVPSGEPVEVTGTELDLRRGKALRGLELDTAFGSCAPGNDGLIRHELTHSGGGVELWAQACFGWVQVFTPAEFPGKGARAVAIEPMTCPPDALNSGTDLIWLAPDTTWTGRWGISPVHSRG